MRIAVTGGTGFVGRHLVRRLESDGHEVIVISRRTGIDLGSADRRVLRDALEGCEALVLCAGINLERGQQTYDRIHVHATASLVAAAAEARVGRVVLLSFLRARPDGPDAYHRTKWAAEELVRGSGLEWTVLKAGVIFGRGDHLLDHVGRALRTWGVFALVGGVDRGVAPVAVADVAAVLAAAATGDRRLCNVTVAVLGPEAIPLEAAVRRVGAVLGRRPLVVRLPVRAHLLLAAMLERTMRVPIASRAQVRILAEGVVEPIGAVDPLPADLRPRARFDPKEIRTGLPTHGRFGCRDLRWCGS